MKSFIIFLLILAYTVDSSSAGNRVPSDAETLNRLFEMGINQLLEPHKPLSGEKVSLTFSGFITLSHSARETTEAIFTACGLSITDNEHTADFSFVITLSEARIVLYPVKGGYHRRVSIIIHMKCLDSEKKVLWASGHEEITNDSVPEQQIDSTNDGERFCNAVKRRILKRSNRKLRVFSFIITVTLAYFAFK